MKTSPDYNEQRRDNSLRQNANLMDEYLASQFLDRPYEVNAWLTSAAKYGEAAHPIA
jgi:hypothetical protein